MSNFEQGPLVVNDNGPEKSDSIQGFKTTMAEIAKAEGLAQQAALERDPENSLVAGFSLVTELVARAGSPGKSELFEQLAQAVANENLGRDPAKDQRVA